MIKISLYFFVAVRTFNKQTHNKTLINITNFLKSLIHLAEGEGFEPPERCRSTVFKTAAIDHSANPPYNIINHKRVFTPKVNIFCIIPFQSYSYKIEHKVSYSIYPTKLSFHLLQMGFNRSGGQPLIKYGHFQS